MRCVALVGAVALLGNPWEILQQPPNRSKNRQQRGPSTLTSPPQKQKPSNTYQSLAEKHGELKAFSKKTVSTLGQKNKKKGSTVELVVVFFVNFGRLVASSF